MPHCRPLGNGLHEVRTNLDNRTARVLFFADDARMVLVHGFIKKTRAMPIGHGPGIGPETRVGDIHMTNGRNPHLGSTLDEFDNG